MATILTCDDNPVITDFVGSILSAEHEVFTASNGKEALELINNEVPDLIIIDIMMPIMDGIEVLKTIKADDKTKSIPVIILTALGKDEDIVKGLDAGADDYIEKPFNAKVFTARVKALLRIKSLYDNIEESKRDIETSLEIISGTTSTLNMQGVLQNITEQIAEHLKLDRCSVVVIDEDKENAYIMASSDDRNVQSLKIKVEKYPELKEAIDTSDVLIVDDVHTHPVMEAIGELLNMPYRSILVVPISHGEEAVGTILLNAKKKDKGITERDVNFCRLVAASSSNAIKNAYLFDKIGEKNVELDIANKKLKELDKLKSNFIAMASHELRTPINVISGYIEMILDGTSGEVSKRSREFLEAALESCTGLASTLKEMLDISIIESGKLPFNPAKNDLGSLIEATLKPFKAQTSNKGVELEFDSEGEKFVAEVDKLKFGEILTNLLTNALKFTDKGGNIKVGLSKANGEFIISVSDTGKGISENEKNKIFEEFYTSSDTGDGTGLGLPICRRFVEMHGGRIWVESNEDKGATIFFTIPIN